MEEIAIEIFNDDSNRLRERPTNDVTLHLADGTLIDGREATCHHIAKRVQRNFDILKIDHSITHGRVGAANGLLTIEGDQIGFCVVVEFMNTKAERLQAIKLYGP